MSDQSDAVAFTGQGKPGTPSEPEANATQQKYLTQNDVDRIVNDITEQVVRRTQGLIDKQTGNINKRIQEGLGSLEKVVKIQRDAGIEITPAQEENLRQRVITQAYAIDGEPSHPPEPSPGTRQSQPDQGGAQEIDPVTADAIAMMQEANVFISNDDPEAESIRAAKTPRQYLKAVEEAIAAKQERTSAGTEQQPGGEGGSRAPTNVGGSGGKANLRRQYNEEVSKVRGDVWAVTKLKQKYRKQGLDI